jgi:hypothetical protein
VLCITCWAREERQVLRGAWSASGLAAPEDTGSDLTPSYISIGCTDGLIASAAQILHAIKQTYRYHFGSVVFGALIITLTEVCTRQSLSARVLLGRRGCCDSPIVVLRALRVACGVWRLCAQLLRLALAYVERQTKGLQEANSLVKCVLKGCACCLWCFEKVVK